MTMEAEPDEAATGRDTGASRGWSLPSWTPEGEAQLSPVWNLLRNQEKRRLPSSAPALGIATADTGHSPRPVTKKDNLGSPPPGSSVVWASPPQATC